MESIVNLSDYLLFSILSYLSDTDKICFTLSCKGTFTRFKDRLQFDSLQNSNQVRVYLKSFAKSHLSTKQTRFFITTFKELIELSDQYKLISNNDNNQEEVKEITLSNKKYNANIDVIEFDSSFNEYIPPNLIPKHIKELTLGSEFNQEFNLPDILPPNLETLYLDAKFNKHLDSSALPKSIKKLHLSYEYNREIKVGLFHEGLEDLQVGIECNQYLGGGRLPKSLKVLDMGYAYSYAIEKDDIPPNIQSLEFPYNYEGFKLGDLHVPEGCKKVILPASTDQEAYSLSSLPQSLVSITRLRVQHIPLLPSTLSRLEITTSAPTQFSSAILPRFLTKLLLDDCALSDGGESLPSTLVYLKIGNDSVPITHLPVGLKKLILNSDYNSMVPSSIIPNLESLRINSVNFPFLKFFSQPDFPTTINSLEFSRMYSSNNLELSYIPESVTKLKLYVQSKQEIDVPSTVKHLSVLGSDAVPSLSLRHVIGLSILHICIKGNYYYFDIRSLGPDTVLILFQSIKGGIIKFKENDLNTSFEKFINPYLNTISKWDF